MNIYEKDNMIIIENICDFDLNQIFDSGQCFRWKKQSDNSYTCVVKENIINVSQIDNTLYFKNTIPFLLHKSYHPYHLMNLENVRPDLEINI